MAPQFIGVKTADFQDVFRRQLCSTVFFSALLTASTCFLALFVILILSSEMKVEWIATTPNVARMEHFLADRNCSVINLPRNSVSAFWMEAVPEATITVIIQSPIVEPASVIYQDSALETFAQSSSRRLNQDLKKSVASIPASTCEMPRGIISSSRVEIEMLQTNTKHIVTSVANAEWSGGAIEIKPEPASSHYLAKYCSSSVVGASSPNRARSQCGIVRRYGTSTINVLVESKNGVYELGRHNGAFVVISGFRSADDRLDAATLSKCGNEIKLNG